MKTLFVVTSVTFFSYLCYAAMAIRFALNLGVAQ